MVFDGLQMGGVERVGVDYAKLFYQKGYEVTIINLNPNLTELENEFSMVNDIVHIRFPRKFAPEQYTQLVKRNYFCKFLYPFIYLVILIGNFLYKPFCKIIFGLKKEYDIAIAFSGHFNDLTFIASNFVKAHKKIGWLHGALYSYVLVSDGYLNLYRKIRNLVVLVEDAQEEVICYNKTFDLNIQKMYNPVFVQTRNINEVEIRKIKERCGKFMLMVSRFSYPHKDQFTVAKALEIVREKYGENINLVFVGSGPDEGKVKEYVLKLSQETQKHIFFEGIRYDVQNYYKAAYMLVHASVAGEGLPTVMLEALAYELPMVVTDSKVGPREILRDNEFGLLCHVQDPEDMAEKIYRLCQDNELYQSYRQRSKIRIKDFEPETIKKQLSKVIKKLVD